MDSDQVKRMKSKLKLYGSYTREINRIQSRLKEIHTAQNLHWDWPEAAAKESGFRSLDKEHTAVHQMTIEDVSLQYQLKELIYERSSLNLETFIKRLDEENQRLLQFIYIEGKSYEETAWKINLTKSGVRDRISSILKSPHACG